jgi:hypothetical protein
MNEQEGAGWHLPGGDVGLDPISPCHRSPVPVDPRPGRGTPLSPPTLGLTWPFWNLPVCLEGRADWLHFQCEL